jgi:hypothetical protein
MLFRCVHELEHFSQVKMIAEQRGKLAEFVRTTKIEKLEREALDAHQKIYQKIKDKIMSDHALMTGTPWPTRVKLDKFGSPVIDVKTGLPKIEKAQVHHIIPQEYGGPHQWWNASPIFGGAAHQGGIHRANSALREILDFIK